MRLIPKLTLTVLTVCIFALTSQGDVTFLKYTPVGPQYREGPPEEETVPAKPEEETVPAKPEVVKVPEDKVAKTAYESMGFSAGVGAIYMFDDDALDSASLDSNGILRVDKQSQARITAVLQAYYPIFNGGPTSKMQTELKDKVISPGSPYVTSARPTWGFQALLELGGEDIIRSFGLGFLCSWRKYEIESPERIRVVAPAFNVGVAAIMEAKVKTLGEGLTANATLPAGDAIRFEEEPKFGLAITFSAGF